MMSLKASIKRGSFGELPTNKSVDNPYWIAKIISLMHLSSMEKKTTHFYFSMKGETAS